ncbi:phage portal protein [Devosia sp. 2618]|uniref:phage portal protein n=1 Tax=Devosia sp. 2618 TaxID=3156454 RepID=UPI0033983695
MNPFGWLAGWGSNPKISGRDSKETQAAYADRAPVRASIDRTLSLSTAWACIRLLSETSGTLPLPLYRKIDQDRREVAGDHALYGLLHDSPNAWQTAAEFWEGQVAQLCGWGNAFSEQKMLGERLVALEPLPPTTTVRRDSNGDLRYSFSDRGRTEMLPASKIFHIRGFGFGGEVGLSPIRYGWQVMRGAIAAEDAAVQFMEGGLQIAGFAKEGATGKSTSDQRKELMELFAEFMGSKAAGKVMPLPKDWDWQQLTMNPEDAQMIETRGFNVEQVCRIYRVPPFMVGHTQNSTSWGSGLESQNIGFLTYALRPYLVRIEQSVKKQLLKPSERGSYYAEFVLEGLLRADSTGRAALYASGGQNGWMTRNEMRRRENLIPVEGGDVLTVQSNLLPLDQLGKTPPRAVQPAPGDPV